MTVEVATGIGDLRCEITFEYVQVMTQLVLGQME
jgi:hypothetical protein